MPRSTVNSRRMTVGGAVNSRRKSVDPSIHNEDNGKSPAVPTRSARGRASMIPRMGRENAPPLPANFKSPKPTSKSVASVSISSSRRSSVGGDRRQSLANPAAPAKVDPRPVGDKAFQQECIKQLTHFLVQSGYEYPISNKSLVRPSGKDFSNIVSFMLRKVDPAFQDGTMKFEDEVAMNFKALGYPFPVSKTALVAAGSPHTWPALLAALHWLMERLQLVSSVQDNLNESGRFDSLEELEARTDKAFFKYLSGAYTAFLRGDEQGREHLENALADRLERDDYLIENEIQQITDKNAYLVEKINNLTEGTQDLELYNKKKSDYLTDLDQFHDLIRQLDDHVATLTQKKKERAQELEETNRTLARVTASVESLKETIRNQEMSLEDVEKMQNEKKGVEEAIDRAVKLKEDRLKDLWEVNSELDKLWTDLESVVSEYNSKLGELNVLPFVSAKGVPMKIVVNKGAALENDEKKLLGVNLTEAVTDNLMSCKHEYMERLSDAKWKYQEALDQVDQSEEALNEALANFKIVHDKSAKSEETLRKEREAEEAKLAVRQREVEAMEGKVASLRDPVALEEQMARYERQCAELESLRIRFQEESAAKKKAVIEEIEQKYQEMIQFEAYFANKIEQVETYWRDSKARYGDLNLPSGVCETDD